MQLSIKVVKMSIYQRIKDLANEKNITVKDVERALGYSNGTLGKWKDSTNSASLGRTKSPVKTLDDEINEALDRSVGTSGEPITDNDRAIIKGMIEAYIKNKG